MARICRAEEWRGGVFVEKAPQNLHSIHSIVEYMKHLMYLTTDARRVIFHSRYGYFRKVTGTEGLMMKAIVFPGGKHKVSSKFEALGVVEVSETG